VAGIHARIYSRQYPLLSIALDMYNQMNAHDLQLFRRARMSIYESLTDSFLAARRALPEAKWSNELTAFTDEYFKQAAISVYSKPTALEGFDDLDFTNAINNGLDELERTTSQSYRASVLFQMLLDLEFDFPLNLVFGMAFADGDPEKISETWGHCEYAIWNEFSKCISESPGKENTLRLCKILDVLYQFALLMIGLGFTSDNAFWLAGIADWFEVVTELVNKFLTHEDILELSIFAHRSPLASMHSSVPTAEWLADEFAKGWSFLANNPNLPSELVDNALQEKEWASFTAPLLLHPNANPEIAINRAIEILESGAGWSLFDSLREWDNTRDDAFENFNSYRSTSQSGRKVLSAIMEWCKKNPDRSEGLLDELGNID